MAAGESKSVEQIELENLKNSPNFLRYYQDARESLKISGVINFLRIFARPHLISNGGNIYESATSAAISAGYNKCLDDLMYFEEKYLLEPFNKKNVRPDFGAKTIAFNKGDISKEEKDRL